MGATTVPTHAAPSYVVGCIAWVVRATVQFDGKSELLRDWNLSVY